jgi:hypothetical protein
MGKVCFAGFKAGDPLYFCGVPPGMTQARPRHAAIVKEVFRGTAL